MLNIYFNSIIIFILSFVFSHKTIYSNSIQVCVSCQKSSIKNAIYFAKSHDSILVLDGVYFENNININKPLIILGKSNAIIDGDGNSIFQIKSDSVVIKNLVLRNVKASYSKEKAAIHLLNSHDFIIENNTILNTFFGVLIEKSSSGKIVGNNISGQNKEEYNSGNGIHLWHSSFILILNNTVEKMRDGIYFEFVDNCKISENKSCQNIRYGLHFMFSNNNIYNSNYFKNNGAGVAVMFSKNIIMTKNVFIKNWGAASYGLLLKEIYDAEIANNLFEENTIAIKAEGSNRIKYDGNTFKSNGWAIKILGACYSNNFINNDFLNNSFDVSFHGRLNDNLFLNNYWSEYTGYDLDKDGYGDVAFRPVKLFSYIVNNTPETIILMRSLFIDMINYSEKISPIFTPDNLVDNQPLMKAINEISN
jgi:nitrous oxidase accessory protein